MSFQAGSLFTCAGSTDTRFLFYSQTQMCGSFAVSQLLFGVRERVQRLSATVNVTPQQATLVVSPRLRGNILTTPRLTGAVAVTVPTTLVLSARMSGTLGVRSRLSGASTVADPETLAFAPRATGRTGHHPRRSGYVLVGCT